MYWNDKPYHSLDYEMKRRFGSKVYKIALDGGMTCPNRDGTIGTGGCIFCSEGGSGDFAARMRGGGLCESDAAVLRQSISSQIEEAAGRIRGKLADAPAAYIAYFQSYTNTYAPISYLREIFTAAIEHPDVKILSIATRPDCLPEEVLELCKELNRIKPVWIELGLQTIHEDTAQFIRRGYPLATFEDAVTRLHAHGLETIVHVILGLPGESRKQMLETVSYLAHHTPEIQGIKLQLLHVLRGTELGRLYEENPKLFPVLSMEEYIDLVIDCIALLPPDMVVHRITGDGPKSLLMAPMWSGNKRMVLNTMARRFRERGLCQGDQFSNTSPFSSMLTLNEMLCM
jgi:hypothetical protein